jgi:hypothetical protein
MRMTSGLLAAGMLALAANGMARDEVRAAGVDTDQVTVWNRFADRLMALHEKQIQGRKIRETEEFGGYARMPRFYREVSYYDVDSGRLMSRIQWETEHPDRVHSIEVYVYDSSGRLLRDYMAWYLPKYRNAPRATTINLYHYGHGVRGWRQFDASGNRLYERCNAWAGDQAGEILVELDEDEHAEALSEKNSIMTGELYLRCFGDIRASAGPYLNPH